jgi:hypothetical protein
MPGEARTAPARSRSQRKTDTLEKLRTDVDLWIASASEDGHAYLVPLSYHRDGSTLTLATPRASRTARNLIRAGWARAALGPTRDVVIIEGQSRRSPSAPSPRSRRGTQWQPVSTQEASPTRTSTSGSRRTRSRRGAKQTSSKAATSCAAESGSTRRNHLAQDLCTGRLAPTLRTLRADSRGGSLAPSSETRPQASRLQPRAQVTRRRSRSAVPIALIHTRWPSAHEPRVDPNRPPIEYPGGPTTASALAEEPRFRRRPRRQSQPRADRPRDRSADGHDVSWGPCRCGRTTTDRSAPVLDQQVQGLARPEARVGHRQDQGEGALPLRRRIRTHRSN